MSLRANEVGRHTAKTDSRYRSLSKGIGVSHTARSLVGSIFHVFFACVDGGETDRGFLLAVMGPVSHFLWGLAGKSAEGCTTPTCAKRRDDGSAILLLPASAGGLCPPLMNFVLLSDSAYRVHYLSHRINPNPIAHLVAYPMILCLLAVQMNISLINPTPRPISQPLPSPISLRHHNHLRLQRRNTRMRPRQPPKLQHHHLQVLQLHHLHHNSPLLMNLTRRM